MRQASKLSAVHSDAQVIHAIMLGCSLVICTHSINAFVCLLNTACWKCLGHKQKAVRGYSQMLHIMLVHVLQQHILYNYHLIFSLARNIPSHVTAL